MDRNLMKEGRLRLDRELKAICPNVYYQPPPSVKMEYPAIRYFRSNINSTYADNMPYLRGVAYDVRVVDRDPDSAVVDAVSQLSCCRHTRHYTFDNMNYDNFLIYR